MRIGLLGGVRVYDEGGEPVDVGSAMSQTLLAALALSPGVPLPAPRLIELVWGDTPPRTAEKTLQWHIAQLRKSLGADVITRVGAAYRLEVSAQKIDTSRFIGYLHQRDIPAALAEWIGPPLAGLDAPGLDAAMAGLTEQWLDAVGADLRSRVETDPRAAIGRLTELVEEHPLREGFWALLMTALYRCDRQAEALAAYRKAREHLVDQLGIEPGPSLRELEAKILKQDDELRGDRGDIRLPRSVAGLVGRDDDRVAVVAALRAAPIVTLVGPGGIGKTQLALAAAHTAARAHGWNAWLVELAEISEPADVPRAAADALGVAQRPGHTLLQSIVAAVRARPTLILIDNCEHVLEPAAALAQALATASEHVHVLATSRERLWIADEQVIAVSSLDIRAGVELFRARAAGAGRALEEGEHLAEICRRLDGIPLAIELAAARMRTHRPADLLARLDEHAAIGAAVGERRTGAPRHRSVRAAVRWSYELLTEAEQALFRRLSVFAGHFDAEAARAVGDEREVLFDLVERSLVTVEFGQRGPRFRMLEPIRQFAAELLREQGEAETAAELHARWCLGEVAQVGRLLAGQDEAEGVGRLAELWASLRAAFGWAVAQGDVRFADALVRPIVTELPLRGRQEIGVWAERILALPGESGLRGFWLLWASERYTQNGNQGGYQELAERYADPGSALCGYAQAYVSGDGAGLHRLLPEASGEAPELAAYLELASAGTLLGIGRFAEVDQLVSALAHHYRADGPPTLLHWTLQTLAYSAAFQGRSAQADGYFDEAAHVAIPPGTLSANKTTEARSAFRRGEHQRACALLLSYAEELLETGNVVAASVVAIEFVNLTAALGRLDEAGRMLGYLKAANDFGAMAAMTLVAEAARGLPDPGGPMDDRAALVYMRDRLGYLAQAR